MRTLNFPLIAMLGWLLVGCAGSQLFASEPDEVVVAHQRSEGVDVLLMSGPCRMKERAKNLPGRAVKKEKGVVSEGCYGTWNKVIVLMYFEDGTVAFSGIDAFTPVKTI